MKNYYKILGISNIASDAEIKKAYRRLSLLFHPDVNKSPDAAAKFIEINKAYEILIDPQQRAAYDYFLKSSNIIYPRPYDTPRERIVVYDDIPYYDGVQGTKYEPYKEPPQTKPSEISTFGIIIWIAATLYMLLQALNN